MKRSIRVALLACAAIASLAFAGSALASFAPKIVVSAATPGANGGATRIGVLVGNSDDATAKASFYIPSAYQVGTPAAGTKLGNVTATASAAALGGAILPLTGELDAIAPSAATNAAAAQCGVSPSQTWDLHLTAAGQVLDIPMFVAATAAPGYSNELVVCLPPPQTALDGAKLLSATFTSSAITEPSAPGDYRWTSLWTPYASGATTPNPAGSVEVQGLQHLPAAVKLTVTKKRITTFVRRKIHGKSRKVQIVRTLVRFSSTVTEGTGPAASAVITTTAGGKKVGGASGSFTLASGKSAVLRATAVVDSDSGSVPTGQTANPLADLYFHDLGASGCTPSAIFGGLPCTDATVGGQRLSAIAKVKGYK
ncbi:MAG TPA: hypothetical protein VMU73_08415 [Gaiellaceae bacterium]|nr:hypothetical protein [Gaiellaceae bacterium]